jgi:hypothetical protein
MARPDGESSNELLETLEQWAEILRHRSLDHPDPSWRAKRLATFRDSEDGPQDSRPRMRSRADQLRPKMAALPV